MMSICKASEFMNSGIQGSLMAASGRYQRNQSLLLMLRDDVRCLEALH